MNLTNLSTWDIDQKMKAKIECLSIIDVIETREWMNLKFIVYDPQMMREMNVIECSQIMLHFKYIYMNMG